MQIAAPRSALSPLARGRCFLAKVLDLVQSGPETREDVLEGTKQSQDDRMLRSRGGAREFAVRRPLSPSPMQTTPSNGSPRVLSLALRSRDCVGFRFGPHSRPSEL